MEQEKLANFNNIVIEKDSLIQVLKENKEKHDALFELSVQGFWEQAEEKLKEKKSKFNKSISICNKGFKKALKKSLDAVTTQNKDEVQFYCPSPQIDNSWNLPYPANYTTEYDKAIKMLELSVYDKVTVTKQEFNSYVLNEWEWKNNLVASNSLYVNSVTGKFEKMSQRLSSYGGSDLLLSGAYNNGFNNF
jgi:hypothetical protein